MGSGFWRKKSAAPTVQSESGEAGNRPLSSFPKDSHVIIRLLEGGKGFRTRMINLGIVPGETVRIIRAAGITPLVLEVKGGRVMLGKGAAEKIIGGSES